MLKKFLAPFETASMEIRKKVPSLLVTILLIAFLLLSLAVISFITGDIRKGGILLVSMGIFMVFLYRLGKGGYATASTGVIVLAFVVLGFFVITADFTNPYALHKAALYLFMPLVLCGLIGISFLFQRILSLVNLIILILLFVLRSLPSIPAELKGELIGQAVVDFFLFLTFCVMMDRLTHIARSLVDDAEKAREVHGRQVKKFTTLIEGSAQNLDISQELNNRIGDVFSRLEASRETTDGITRELESFQTLFDQTLTAVGVIGEKIRDLHSYILNQNSSQIESSAAVNEMVASISSVAEVVRKKQVSTLKLRESAQNGNQKLETTSRYISEISSSVENIMEMLSIINSRQNTL